MTNLARSRAAVVLLALLAGAGCAWNRAGGNTEILITTPTTESTDVTLTVTSVSARSGSVRTFGMRVDTVGDDTVVTRMNGESSRRFILKGLKMYSGAIRLSSVHLVFADVSVWIDGKALKVNGPDYAIDRRLDPSGGGDDAGRDLVIVGGKITVADGG